MTGVRIWAVIVLASMLSVWASCSGPPVLSPRIPAIRPPVENTFLFAGDVMLTRDVGRRIREKKDPAWPFRQIAPYLASADLTFVNLESPFSDKGKRTEHGLIFNADPANIAGLLLAGVDIASAANNHSRDCGSHGVEFTYRWLKSHGIEPVGTGESAAEAHRGVVLTRHGVRFGFLAYTYDQKNGNWRNTDDRIADIDIPTMKRDAAEMNRRCDVLIVSMHNGIEYQKRPNRNQIDFAHAAIDAGATLVIGHHPHVTQPMECYGQGVIFYSLGNFIFDQFQRQETQKGSIARVQFLGRYVESAEMVPVQITRDGPVLAANLRPALSDPHDAGAAR
ncbi:MAG TPA: CapA family protein [Bryobacteraceae bacterium]|nr:CapA family protein [Bryobacteraceae bacterium]